MISTEAVACCTSNLYGVRAINNLMTQDDPTDHGESQLLVER